MPEIKKEFELLQKKLLKYKYLYYIKIEPEINDAEYDRLERKSYALAKKLGFRADTWEGPEENEKHHIHWMVGFSEKHSLWDEVKREIEKE